MRFYALSSVVCLGLVAGLTGCAADPKAALVGNYQIDSSTVKLPPALMKQPGIDKLIKEQSGKVSLKLNSDNTYAIGGGPKPETGKWTFNDKEVTINSASTPEGLKLKIGADKKSLEMTQPLGNEKITMTFVKTG